ncbi:MAG: DUF2461 domain-containing protein [Thermoplasmata archaeon]|nr:DUF2461 domain-containing protein [Thermoplasmata archaeon]
MAKPALSEPYFGPDLFTFLRELSRNNRRDWFLKNKARYESSVQAPAVRFIEAMGAPLERVSHHLVADARAFGGSLGRIYRDTRFSKDKSPYRTTVGIHFSHEGAKGSGEHFPGFYLHIAPGESMVYSGVWRPEAPAATRIRQAIVSRSAEWAKLRRHGIEVEGDSYARVPAGFDKDHPMAEDLKRKDFYARRAFKDSEVTGPKFGSVFLAACKGLDPLNRFLAEAMGVDW